MIRGAQGRLADALRLYRMHEEACARLRDAGAAGVCTEPGPASLQASLCAQAGILFALGDTAAALRLFDRAATLCREVGDRPELERVQAGRRAVAEGDGTTP